MTKLNLHDDAECIGESALFSATSREAFAVARSRCSKCPVIAACLAFTRPEEGYTGTCGGRLWYDGIDVTHDLSAMPPPCYREAEVDISLAVGLQAPKVPWQAAESTRMAAAWLYRQSHTVNRVAQRLSVTKPQAAYVVQVFEEESSQALRDALSGMLDAC